MHKKKTEKRQTKQKNDKGKVKVTRISLCDLVAPLVRSR
jgi:hypothetical protein